MLCVALRCVALRCVALRCVALRCVALRCVALRCVALRCVALCCVVLCCVVLCFVMQQSVCFTSVRGQLPLSETVDVWISDNKVRLQNTLQESGVSERKIALEVTLMQ